MTRIRFGAQLQPLREFRDWPTLTDATRQSLVRALDTGEMIVFAGAGTSKPYGYLLWRELVAQVTSAVSDDAENLTDPSKIEKDFIKYSLRERTGHTGSSELAGILDYCHRMYFRRGIQKEFSDHVKEAITATPTTEWPGVSVVRELARRLKIRRFITTNYDEIIQRELLPDLIRESAAVEIDGRLECPTINRLDADPAELTQFAMRVGRYRCGVLHLHGSLAKRSSDRSEPDIVLTETQYQRQYASDHVSARDRRDAYNLLFAANPILFVGSSLEEDDVLRPLRQFVADNDIAARHRPWFALLPIETDRKWQCNEIFHRYYYRYGIRVLFVEYESDADISKSLILEIERLENIWLRSKREAAHIPWCRRPEFKRFDDGAGRETRVARHAPDYALTRLTQVREFSDRSRTARLPEDWATMPGLRSVVVLGQQGRGKGSMGYRLALESKPGDDEHAVGFFATTHFANEFNSMVQGAQLALEHAAKALDLENEIPSSLGMSTIESFVQTLRWIPAHCFFVFGGFERLLRRIPYQLLSGEDFGVVLPENRRWLDRLADGDPSDRRSPSMSFRWGRPANLEVATFLRTVLTLDQDPQTETAKYVKRVFLTTSVFPAVPMNRSRQDDRRQDRRVQEKRVREDDVNAIRTTISGLDEKLRESAKWMEIQEHVKSIESLTSKNLYALDALHHSIDAILGPLRNLKKEEVDTHICNSMLSFCCTMLRELELEIGNLERREKSAELIHALIIFLSGYMPRIEELHQSIKISNTDSPGIESRRHAWPWLRLIVETLSTFTTPIEVEVLCAALAEIAKDRRVADELGSGGAPLEAGQWRVEKLRGFMEHLATHTRLVLPIHASKSEKGDARPCRYTAHSLVRQAMWQRLGQSDRPAEVQLAHLNDYASEPAEVQPLKADSAKRTLAVFDALAEQAEASNAAGDARMYIRAAYGLVRAGWSAIGLGRLLTEGLSVGSPAPVYQQYHRRLARLLNLVYAQGQMLSGSSADGLHADAALYPDELAWLVNELGLVCYCEGALMDGDTFFRLGERVNLSIEPGRPGYRRIQSRINLASILIDRGQLRRAGELLVQAATWSRDWGEEGEETMARIHGFLGLVAHLRGDSGKALGLYNSAIDVLSRWESWRGASVFHRHRSDLHRGEGRLREARTDLEIAIATAETGFHPDLVHYCRVSLANLNRHEASQGASRPVSVDGLEHTLQFARSIGSAKLESDAHRVKGLIEHDQRDFEAATRSALSCLWLSKAYGFQLRLMSSLELLGRVMIARNYSGDAKQIFESVVQMGHELEYQRPMEYAERALLDLGGWQN